MERGGREGGRDRHTDRLTETETMHSARSLINTHDDASFFYSLLHYVRYLGLLSFCLFAFLNVKTTTSLLLLLILTA